MNALLNINIRVNSAAANAQIKELRSNLSGLGGSVSSNKAGISAFSNTLGSISGIEKFGKNLQWTGRQLEFNFTLPLVLAGAAATKFALENENAMVGVRKVYGDLSDDSAMLNNELNALSKSFELLSSRFGVHQSEVIDIAAAWAQAGAAGVGLAKATRLTLEAMILGEMDATQATNGLIAVQSAYRLNTVQLHDALAQLNVIENQTSISFSGLIDVITRAGGSAASAGIDIRHLAAMAASLVPATGSAAQAGNALKTVISRIMAPTKDAADVMAAFGIDILDASWQAKNGVQRIETLAQSFDGLTQSQKAVASALIASRWQINRFDILLGDIAKSLDDSTKKQSSYAKALDATSDAAKYNAVYARELSTVLASTPRGFQILWNIIRNGLATAIAPLIPALAGLLSHVAQVVTWFSNLDPGIQQVVLGFLVLLAAIGPVVRYFGSFILLGSTLTRGLVFLRGALFGLSAAEIAAATSTDLANTSLLTQNGIIGLLGKGIWKLITGPFKLLGLAFDALTGIASYLLSAFSTVFSAIGGLIITVLWRAATLGTSGMASIILSGIIRLQSAWIKLVEIMRFIWLNLTVSMSAIWIGFQRAWIAVTMGMRFLWLNLTVGMQAIWLALVRGLTFAWFGFQSFLSSFPSFWAAMWGVVTRITELGVTAISKLTTGLVAFMEFAGEAIAAALSNPWTLIIIGIAAVLIALRKQIAAGIQWIIDQFKKLIPAIAAIMKKVYELLSYINPFAKHSPSLVENVTKGVDAILSQYERLNGISSILGDALSALDAFNGSGISGIGRSAEMANYQKQKDEIVSVSPAAGPEIDHLIDQIFRLKDALSLIGDELESQRRAVQEWERSLEQAMQPINDAIFENTMAQKRLRLEILKLDQAGISVDKLRDRMAGLAGDMEMLRSQSTELRLAGAGSDILGSYDQQLAAMENEFGALQNASKPVEDLQKQLDDLQTQGEILQLQKDLEFDPQLRALDAQKKKVSELEDAYRTVDSTIGDMESALRQAAQAASDLKDAAKDKSSFGEQEFAAAAAGDFAVPGGDSVPGLGREGGLPDIEQFNTDLEAELQKALKDMGKIDMFAPIKDLWKSTWNWIKDNVGPVVGPVVDAVSAVLGKISFGTGGFSFNGIKQSFTDFYDFLKSSSVGDVFGTFQNAWNTLTNFIKDAWDNVLSKVFDFLVRNITWAGKQIGDELKNWAPMFDKIIEVITHVYNVIADILGIFITVVFKPFLAAIIGLWIAGWPVLLNVIEPIFRSIVSLIRAALEIIRGIISFFLDIINGDWGKAWNDILTIVDGIWDEIWTAITFPVKLIIGLIKGLVEGIVHFFQWLYDVLVGHSIIPDMVNAIIDVFQMLFDVLKTIWEAIWTVVKFAWDNIAMPVFNAIKWTIENIVVPAFEWAYDHIKPVFEDIGSAIKWVWDNVISKVFDWIKAGLDDLGSSFTWFKDHVVDPVWNGIKEIIKGVWNGLAEILEGGINGFIMAFNVLARGINLVTGAIGFGPHIDTVDHISIKRFAKGGIPAYEAQGAGGVFNRPTAIVGEGSKVYPEYVIPTDPRYRSNAERLMMQAASAMYASGGVVGKTGTGDGLGDIISSGIDFVEGAFDVGKAIVTGGFGVVKAFWDLVAKIPAMLSGIGVKIPKEVGKFLLETVKDWAWDLIKKGIFKDKDELGDNPGWQKMWDTLHQNFPDAQLFSAVREGATTVSGNQSYHALGRAIDVSPRDDIFSWIRNTYKANTKELIYSPWGNANIKNGQDFLYDDAVRAEHWDHIHWAMKSGGIIPYGLIPSLGSGGIVEPTPGGLLVRVGERGQREKISPLPHGNNDKSEYNFYGDLSFPNITKPEDASKFLRNLKSLAGGTR